MALIAVIQAGEGGTDSDLLVYEQYAIYKKFEARQCL
jgi:protein subunit release factor B